LLAAELFDAQMLGRLLGVILTTDGIAEGVAPWMVGRIRDFTGSYSKAFLFLIAVSLLGSAAVLLLPKRAVKA
jgi:cyanate permease